LTIAQTISSLPCLRDPLSVLYDDQANLLLDLIYGETSLPTSAEAFVEIPPADPPDDVDGSLTMHERSYEPGRITIRSPDSLLQLSVQRL